MEQQRTAQLDAASKKNQERQSKIEQQKAARKISKMNRCREEVSRRRQSKKGMRKAKQHEAEPVAGSADEKVPSTLAPRCFLCVCRQMENNLNVLSSGLYVILHRFDHPPPLCETGCLTFAHFP